MKTKPTAVKRALYGIGTRRRFVWDALCGAECRCEATAPTKPAAVAQAVALHSYRQQAPAPIVAGGCRLETHAPGEWWFELRSGTPRATSYAFHGASQAEAIAIIVRAYADHADVAAFIAAQGA